MTNHPLKSSADLLTQVLGICPTISLTNSVEIEFQDLSVGIWHDRGLYSVTIGYEMRSYLSSAIASFFSVEIHDAKESPIMLIENLEFVRDKAMRIRNLLKEKSFAKRYQKESGYKPISNRPGA